MDPDWLPANGTPTGGTDVSLGAISVTFTSNTLPTLDTIARGSGSWVTDGVEAGDIMKFGGTTSNNLEVVVTGVTAATLTLRSIDTLVTEGPVSANAWIKRALYWDFPDEARTGHTVIFAGNSSYVTWNITTGKSWSQDVSVVGTSWNNPLLVPIGFQTIYYTEGRPAPAILWTEFLQRDSGEPLCPDKYETRLYSTTVFPRNTYTMSGGGTSGSSNGGSFERVNWQLVSNNITPTQESLVNFVGSGTMTHFQSNLVMDRYWENGTVFFRRLGRGEHEEPGSSTNGCPSDAAWRVGATAGGEGLANHVSDGQFTDDGRSVQVLRNSKYDGSSGTDDVVMIYEPSGAQTPMWPEGMETGISPSKPGFHMNRARDQFVLTDYTGNRYLRMRLSPITNPECSLPWVDIDDIPEFTAPPHALLPLD